MGRFTVLEDWALAQAIAVNPDMFALLHGSCPPGFVHLGSGTMSEEEHRPCDQPAFLDSLQDLYGKPLTIRVSSRELNEAHPAHGRARFSQSLVPILCGVSRRRQQRINQSGHPLPRARSLRPLSSALTACTGENAAEHRRSSQPVPPTGTTVR